jgi:hypothetical protein
MNIKNALSKAEINPNRVFLVDAIGALLTTFFLFGILAQFESFFGMPSKTLYLLSGIAFCLFIYSITCHLLIAENWKPYLKIIIICNIIYGLLSIGFVNIHFEKITEFGIAYFVAEIIIIGIIVFLEYKILGNIS